MTAAIKVGTVARVRTSKTPPPDYGTLVVVLEIAHRMNPTPNRFKVRRLDGQRLGLVGCTVVHSPEAYVAGALLAPIEDQAAEGAA